MHWVRDLEADPTPRRETMKMIDAIVPYNVKEIDDAEGKLSVEGVTVTESIFRQLFGAFFSRSDTHSAHGAC
jgi:hypothetical protein